MARSPVSARPRPGRLASLTCGLLVAGLVAAVDSRAAPDPTGFSFEVLETDCGPEDADPPVLVLSLNDSVLATVPATPGCVCVDEPRIFTFDDAESLALLIPDACNDFRVTVPANGAGGRLFLAIVKVNVLTTEGAETTCLLDGSSQNPSPTCAPRALCESVLAGPASTLLVAVGSDLDDDGVCLPGDNCPAVPNGDQLDTDGSGTGDACDRCPASDPDDLDLDGLCDDVDPCPVDPINDPDGDGFCGLQDNCPQFNPDQGDRDFDGQGDSCDFCPDDPAPFEDLDGDRVCQSSDNCPYVYNLEQGDLDGDGLGDACDPCQDTDGDGYGNPGFFNPLCADDNCPDQGNPDQRDLDQDGSGDLCDPADASLVVTRVRIERDSPSGKADGHIRVEGQLLLPAHQSIELLPFLSVHVSDALSLGYDTLQDLSGPAFFLNQCEGSLESDGRLRCSAARGRLRADFRVIGATSPTLPRVLGFTIALRNVAFAWPVFGPIQATIRHGYAIDQVGFIGSCVASRSSLICR